MWTLCVISNSSALSLFVGTGFLIVRFNSKLLRKVTFMLFCYKDSYVMYMLVIDAFDSYCVYLLLSI